MIDGYKLCLIDADSLCYANAFAVEEKDDDGNRQVQKNGEKFLESNLMEQIRTIVVETNCSDYKLFLTGGGTFRDKDKSYKANRKGMIRPLLLNHARQFLIDDFETIVTEDIEADDAVCMEQTFCIDNDVASCIAHIDKDIDQQEGEHYRWALRGKESVTYHITKEEGLRKLYVQALVGDKVDNIMYYFSEESQTFKKNYGLGQKGAEKFLEIHHTELDMYNAVKSCYLHDPRFIKKDDGEQCTMTDLVRNMNMLYLLREEEDSWAVPVL